MPHAVPPVASQPLQLALSSVHTLTDTQKDTELTSFIVVTWLSDK